MSWRSSITQLGVVVVAVLLAALAGRTAATVVADDSSMSWDLYMDDPAGDCPGAGGGNDADGLIESGECPEVVANFWLQPEGGVGGSQSLFDLANVVWTTGPLGVDVTGDTIPDATDGLVPNRPATLGAEVGEISFAVHSNLSLAAVASNNIDDIAANADPAVTGQPPQCGDASTDTIEMSDTFAMWNAVVDDSNGTVSHLDTDGNQTADTEDPDPAHPAWCDDIDPPPGQACAPKGVTMLPAPIPAIETALGLTPGSAVSRSFGIARLAIVPGLLSRDVDVNLLVYSLHPLGCGLGLGMDGYLDLTLVGYPGAPVPEPVDPWYDPFLQTLHVCPPFWSSPAVSHGVTTDSDFDEDAVIDFAVVPELNRLIVGTGGPYDYEIHKSTDDDFDGDTIPAYADRCDIDPYTGTADDDDDGDTMTGTCDANEDPNDVNPADTFPDGNPGPYLASPELGGWGPGQDVDGDTYLNYVDNCPQLADRDLGPPPGIDYQRDSDGDTVGDVCEIDLGLPGSEAIRGDGSGYASPAPGDFVDNPNICNDRWSIGEPEPQGEAGDVSEKYCLARGYGLGPTSEPYLNPALWPIRLAGYRDSDDDGTPDFWDGFSSIFQVPNQFPYDYFDCSDSDGDTHSDGCETFKGSDALDPTSEPVPGNPPDDYDCDNDGVPDCQELCDGTNPLSGNGGCDRDGDGFCSDAEETAWGLDPEAWYDFFDVPVPARADPQPNGVRNGAIDIGDVLAVLWYSGAQDDGPPNGNGVDYDSDKNGDAVEDGIDYDRTPGALPGPPNGAIDIGDVLACLAQSGTWCPAKGTE